ncbi:MAG: hypothetical protein NVSMB56_00060 [Pyrinomonadaceae bacterium]
MNRLKFQRVKLAMLITSLLISPFIAVHHTQASVKDKWTLVKSKNFTLVGNANEKDIRQVATRLEQFRNIFARLFTKSQFSAPAPTTVIVFKSDGAYKPYKPLYKGKPSNVAGYFQPGSDVNYITLTSERREENPFGIIFHEYTHLLIENSSSNVPAWFNEGLAEFYSTFEVSDGDRKVTLGKPIASHVYLLREKFIPLQDLFRVDHNSPIYNESDKSSIFYAESWAFLHYLQLGNKGARAKQLSPFIKLLSSGASLETSFQKAFQTDFKTMEKELSQYVKSNSYTVETFSFDERLTFDAQMEATTIPDAEATAYLGDLLLHINRLDEAEKVLTQALALDSNSSLAQTALGMVRVRQQRFDDAREFLQRAVAADTKNYLAHYYYAFALSREGMDANQIVFGYSTAHTAEMRAELRKAIALAPQFAESYHLLAFVNLVTNSDLDEGAELMKRALALSPGRQEFNFMLAQIYLRKQNFVQARELLSRLAADNNADSQLRAQSNILLSQLAMMEAQIAHAKEREEEFNRHRTMPSLRNENSTERTDEPPPGTFRQTIKRRTEGEQARGVLTRIDCNSNGSAIFTVKDGDKLRKFHSDAMARIKFISYVANIGGEISCGALKATPDVIVTYRPSPNAKQEGEIVVVEFVPKDVEVEP